LLLDKFFFVDILFNMKIENSSIHPNAKIGKNVTIGPFCVIGENVSIGHDSVIHNNSVIVGNTTIGSNAEIFPFSSIGSKPQDLKYKGEKTFLRIGKNVRIREHVTINPGTEGGGKITIIGDNCLLMVGTHIAHDCRVGDNVIFANNATLGGHVEIGDNAVIGGLSAIHQFVRIGEGAMIGGMSGVTSDVIPFGSVMGNRAKLSGLNLIGLKRSNIKKEEIQNLRQIYRDLFKSSEKNFKQRLKEINIMNNNNQCVLKLLDFLNKDSSRSFCLP